MWKLRREKVSLSQKTRKKKKERAKRLNRNLWLGRVQSRAKRRKIANGGGGQTEKVAK